MAKHNPWMDHLKKFRADHPGMDNKKIFSEARKTYKKGQHGGLPALSPESVPSGMSSSGSALMNIEATQYSGGKSRRVKRRGVKRSAKRSGSKKRSAKRGSSKRHH